MSTDVLAVNIDDSAAEINEDVGVIGSPAHPQEQFGVPRPATAQDLGLDHSTPISGNADAMGESEILDRYAKYGIDPNQYAPPREIFTRPDSQLPERIRGRLTTEQVDFAVGQEQDPLMQMDLFTYTNNFQGAIRRMQQLGLPGQLEAERIHTEAGIPEEMVKRIRRYAPKEMDDLEAYQVAAGLHQLVGPDSYTYRMFTGDPKFAADWVNHAKLYGELDRAIQTAFGSNAEIMAKWFVGSAANLANSIITGIPAAVFQAGSEMRARDLKPQQEIAEPTEFERPEELLFAQGMNQRIREQNAELEMWRTDPEHIAQAQANESVFQSLNETVQGWREAGEALTHLPPAKTGNPVLDTYTRPIIQGLGSYLPSMGMGILARGAVSLPAFVFGLAEAADVYRDNSAAGIDPVSNIFTSLPMGILSGLAERFSLGTSLKSPGLMSLVRRAGGNSNSFLPAVGRIFGGGLMSAASEAGAEGIQTGLSIAAKPFARTLSFGDPLKNVFTALVDNAGEIGWSMWGGGGAGFLGGAGVGRSGMEFANGMKYAKFQKGGTEIAKAADTLIKAKDGDVGKVRTEIKHIIADAQAQGKTDITPYVFADAGDIKHKIDSMTEAEAETLLQDIGVSRAAYEQSVENEVDIQVPTENVLALARDDAQEVRALFRPNPTMESATQLQRQYAETEAMFDLASTMQNTIEADIEQGKVPQVVGDFYTAMRGQEGKSEAEAKAEASLLWSWAQTQAQRRGVTPEVILDGTGIREALAVISGQQQAVDAPASQASQNSIADRIVPMEEAVPGAAATEPVTSQIDAQAWSAEAADTLLSEIGLDPQAYPELAQGIRDAIGEGLNDPDVRSIAEQLGIQLPETAVRNAAISQAAGVDQALHDMIADSQAAPEDIPILTDYARQMQAAGQLVPGESGDMLSAMEREVDAAGREARRLDGIAAAIDRALESGEPITATQAEELGIRAGSREEMRAQAAEHRAEAERWRRFYENPDLLAQIQEGMDMDATGSGEGAIIHDVAGKTAPVVTVEGTGWRGSHPRLRRKAKNILNGFRQQQSNKSLDLRNADTGWEILLTSEGIGKSVYFKHSPAGYQALTKLPELVHNAVLYEESGDRKGRRDVDSYAKLYSPVVVNGELYAAEITIKKSMDGGRKFYLQRLQIVEPAGQKGMQGNPAEPFVGDGKAEAQLRHPPAAGSTYSISRLVEQVKEAESARMAGRQNIPTGEAQLARSTPEHRQATAINVMQAGGQETVSEGLARLFLADMAEYVASGNADARTIQDFERLQAWAGRLDANPDVPTGTPGFEADQALVARNIQNVANGFAAYLREGKAPSIELVNSFDMFSRWLSRVYSLVRGNVAPDLDNNVRGVYDRWLAADEQIQQAGQYYEARYNQALLNLIGDDEERRKLSDALEQNANRIKAQYAGDMVGAWIEAYDAREQIEAEARREVGGRQVYRALADARRAKLDRAGVVALVGEQTANDITATHGDIFQVGQDNPADLELLAIKNDYYSASAMLMDMAQSPSQAEAIEAVEGQKYERRAEKLREWAENQVMYPGDAGWHNPNGDIAAESIEAARQALSRNLQGQRRSPFVERRVIEEHARADIEEMPYRDASDYFRWATAERKQAVRAMEAAARGDTEAALEALDRQLYMHALVTESFRVRQEMQRRQERYAYDSIQAELADVDPRYADPVKDILTRYGINEAPGLQPKNFDPHQLLLPPDSDGMTTTNYRGDTISIDADIEKFLTPLSRAIPEWLQRKERSQDYMGIKDLSIEQMRDIDAAVGLLIDQGRGELHALKTDQAATLAEQKQIVLSTLESLPDRKPGTGEGFLSSLKRSGERYVVSSLVAERILAEADGNPMLQGKEMGLMQTLGDIIRRGEPEQFRILEEFRNDTAADREILNGFRKRLRKQFGSGSFPVDGVDFPQILRDKKGIYTWKPDMLESIFFNMGARGNVYALEQGYGLQYSQLRKLASLATEAEWRAVERIAKRMEQLYPLHNAIHMRQTGKPLKKVEAAPFTVETADGKTITLDGWYYPLSYDWKLSPPDSRGGPVNMADAEYLAGMDAILEQPRSAAGFTHERQTDRYGNPTVGRPQVLSMRVLTNHMLSATRWITHADTLGEFRRLLMDQDIKDAFTKKLGEEKYRALREWANRMARPGKAKDVGLNQVYSQVRNGVTVGKVAGRLGKAIGMAKYLGTAADAMSNASRSKSSGWHWLVQGFKEMGLDGFLGGWVGYQNDAVQRMRAMSPEMDVRRQAFSKELRENLRTDSIATKGVKIGKRRLKRDILYHFAFASDQGLSGLVWWAGYNQAKNGAAGFDISTLTDAQIEEKAIAHADYIVRSSLSSGLSADFSRMQADPGMTSLATQFMGSAAARLSHTYGLAQLWRQGGKTTGEMARHVVNAYAIPAAVKVLLADVLWKAITGDDDDEDNLGSSLVWGMANEATEGLPFIRTAARRGKGVAKRLVNTTEHLADGEVEEAISDFSGAVTGVVPFVTRRR